MTVHAAAIGYQDALELLAAFDRRRQEVGAQAAIGELENDRLALLVAGAAMVGSVVPLLQAALGVEKHRRGMHTVSSGLRRKPK